MEGIGHFDQNRKELIPRTDEKGRILTYEERQNIAERDGVCLRCNEQLFEKRRKTKMAVVGHHKKHLITSDNVYKGICIKCHPTDVPPKILEEWEAKRQIKKGGSIDPQWSNNNHNNNNTNNARRFDLSSLTEIPRVVPKTVEMNT